MFTIQTLDNISPKGLELFNKQNYQIGSDIKDPDIILVRSHKLHDHQFLKNLKAVARAGTGTDNIPVETLTKLGIPVFYAPGANANAVKELVMAAMLMGYRHLYEGRSFLNVLSPENNQSFSKEIETHKKQFVGNEISGKTLGVIGLGNIGVKVANAAFALGMKVFGFDPNLTLNNALALMPGIERVNDIKEILAHSDIITLHVPLNADTTNLMNKELLSLVKPHTLLLNFSREQIVNEEAILHQLENKKLMGYITDFPTIKLAENPQVLCFPHLGASTLEAEQSAAEMVIRNVRRFLEQGSIEYSINFPTISMSQSSILGCRRLLIVNENKPGVIGAIAEKISQLKCNIEQMENKSLGTIAVNIIEISGAKDVAMQWDAQFKEVEGILNVREIESLVV
jgi:D-3-phosphoglycerate dehydrogenase